MMAPHNHSEPGGDRTKPCSLCNKRHVRASKGGLPATSVFKSHNPIYKVTIFLVMIAYASASHSLASSSVGTIKGPAKLGTEFAVISRARKDGNGKIMAFSMRRQEHLQGQSEAHFHEESELDHMHEEGEEHVHEEGEEHVHEEGEEHVHEVGNDNENTSKPWGRVIGATLIVNLATLMGLLLLIIPAMYHGCLKWTGRDHTGPSMYEQGKFLNICIPGFAVGALMATAIFLVFHEAVHLIGGLHEDINEGDHEGHNHRHLQDTHDGHNHSEEGLHAAQFGMAVLGGFLIPVVLSIFFDNNDRNSEPKASVRAMPKEVENPPNSSSGEEAADVGVAVTSHMESNDADDITPVVDKQLCASILVGDAFHNFGDGVFIGAAFLSCSTAVSVSIVVATLFHEIAQELADFILLTQTAGLPVLKATVLNFISGLSVMLGGVVVLAGDPSDSAIGIILAIAGGVYVNIAANETLPRIQKFTVNTKDKVTLIFSFIIGTVPIGLILLDHEHCG
ncbi:hypothetical protein ACHAXS_013194 [Conticribra weissflogii]